MPDAVVIGGGIGGLTAAAALSKAGWSVTVCERAPSLEPVGSGIAVAPNALAALDTIGAGDDVRRLSVMQGEAGLRRSDGRWLVRTSAEVARARFGDPTVLMLRTTLVDIIASRVPEGALRLGTTVEAVDPATGRVSTSGGDLTADLVVAADGIHSKIREALFPDHPGVTYSGVTSWRIVSPYAGAHTLSGGESWGRGTVFGVMPLAGDQVYCYATAPVPPGGGADKAAEKAELLRLFGGWHAPIPELVAAAPLDRLLRLDIHALARPLPALHAGRVVLLGDAAHAMTPNLGQGACQAIEDAVVLAAVADRAGPAGYTEARLARTSALMRRSRSICRLTRWSNPLAVRARDTAMALSGRLSPDVTLRSFDEVFTWRPPRA
ncbi:FAD-dependent oxidoreductase [Sphaerisporangium sp. B11E5]|uniref:FAD-dependent oxidoreductase n=1 Tax=Sphaerisporangium sp. B11E5 TaxID=3153563 RepID=UPI00325DE537